MLVACRRLAKGTNAEKSSMPERLSVDDAVLGWLAEDLEDRPSQSGNLFLNGRP
jgi:hypothetical protein